MRYKYDEATVGQAFDNSTSMEWTPRRERRRTFAKKRQQKRILSSLALAVSFMAYPYGIGEAATDIVPKDSSDAGKIAHSGNVYSISPQKDTGTLAYNRFEKFNLASGDIANLLFGNSSTLANLVQNRINIDGIVNGIKDGKINGHLIFLSPDGIAVGASGVINAGQFTGLIPDSKEFENLYNTENNITLEAINNLKTYANGKTIDISGQVNTHSGIMLGAGIINIKDGAVLQSTKNLDFKDLVKINAGDTVSADLNNVTAVVAGSGGDIILTAKQESAVTDTNLIRWSDRSTDITAAVNIGQDATSKGVKISSSDSAVKITAESTSTYEDSTPMSLTHTLKGIILGDDKTLLDGAIDKLAGKEAGANKYLFVNYSSKKNKASVNIGENSTITANNIDIAANSKVEIAQGITVPAGANKKDSEGKTVPGGSKAVAAVAVSRVYNAADVVIDGNLTASGADGETGNGIKIAANADTKAELSAVGSGGDGNAVAVGVAVLTGDTKAKVKLNNPTNTAVFSAEQGKAAIEAVTNSDVNINAGAVGAASYVVSNVGVANYDTSADVSIDRALTAGDFAIKAENNTTGLKMMVDNTVKPATDDNKGKGTAVETDEQKNEDDEAANAEKNKSAAEKSEDEQESEKKSIDPMQLIKDASVDPADDDKTKDAAGADGKGGIKDVKDKVEGTNEGGGNAAKTSAFGLGASAGVLLNQNNANVTLGKNAVITAAKPEGSETLTGAVNMAAGALLTASKDNENSLQFTVKNAQANSAKVEIGAAVMVSNVQNNAQILLDNEGAKSAQIKGDDAVKLDAQAGMGKYKKADDSEETSLLSYAVSSEGVAAENTPATVVLDGSVGINTQKNNAIILLGQQSKTEGKSVNLSADATTNVKGEYGAKEENNKAGIGATVGLQNIRSNSLIMAGKGVELTGTGLSGMSRISAANSLDAQNEVQNAGKGDSLGISGMVALSYGDSNSIVSLDDESKITAPVTLITATNGTNIDNSARSSFEGAESSKAFGIGVGIVNFDVNSLTMVSDNGKGISAPSGSSTDAQKAAQKIYQDTALAQSIAGDKLTGKLGQSGAVKGSIETGSLTMMALTTGMLQNDAKAKVVSRTAADKGEDADSRKDSEKWTKWSKQGKEGADAAKKNTEDLEQDKVSSQNEGAAPTAANAGKEAGKAANPDAAPSQEEGAAPAAGSSASAGATIGIEGSVALTLLGGRTDAILNNVTVKNTAGASVSSAALSATDILGAITLGGTDIKHSLKSGSGSTKVGIGGTFAMNSSARDVDAILRNSELQQVESVKNTAAKLGIEAAAGMGVSASQGSGTNVAGAGVVYYNKAKQDIHALMLDNVITAGENGTLTNKATGTDFQIAGGLAANSSSGSGTNAGVGGAAAISNLENNLISGISGGTYANKFQSVTVDAKKGTTQINGALAATYAGGSSGYGFEGAFAYGSVKNTTQAYIAGVSGAGLKAGTVNVRAGEIPVIKSDAERNEEKQQIDDTLDSKSKSLLKDAADADKNNKQTLEDKGIDTTGKSYLNTDSAASSLDDHAQNTDEGKVAGEAASEEVAAKKKLGKNQSLTITAAMAGGWNGKAGVGAGIAYNYVKNDIAADVKNSVLTADTLNGEAVSDATIVSVGAGVAIGGKAFNGAGSGSWNDLKNDTKVTFAGNTITGKNISEQVQNESSIINIAGEAAGGKGMAMGLSLAYNSLNNTTGTYLTDNDITLTGTDNAIKLAATNQGKALAVAGGVNVNIDKEILGAVGTVAINRGVSNTESVIDGKTTGENSKLDNVKELSVTAAELTKKTTVAGSVSVGGKKVGVGGAVAYTAVGSSGNKERLRAEINHVDITTTEAGRIEVSTTDSRKNGNNELEKSRVITVGAGFGVSWGKNFFNLQGGAAVSDIYKDSFAAMNNTNINASKESYHPGINVTADTKSKINTVGVGGSVDIMSQVKGAAGVAINRMNQNTKAEMAADSGTTVVNAGLTQVRAAGDADIHSVGVGGLIGVGGQAAFAGSGSYNYMGNNVDAIIKNQKLTSNNSVGVVSQSDDRLYNFAGGFAIGANTKVGIGAAVSINKITGDTNAQVKGGSLTAADEDAIKVTRPQDDKLFTTDKLDLTTDRTKLSESRTEENKTGIVVDSSATHTLISQMSSGGVAASSSVGINVDGTVNLNTIEGKTTAKIQDAGLNSADQYSHVNVNAIDYANIGSFTGTPSIGAAAAAGVSVGVSANWETLERTTAAEISSAGAKKNVYAKDLTVDAIGKHGSSALSLAAAAGGGKVGISSGDSIMRHKYNNTISALMNNVNAIFDGAAKIQAEHLGNSHAQNIGASLSAGLAAVSAGAGVAVMDDTSTVKSEVNSSDLKAKNSTDGKNISVLAKNENNWKETLVTASLAVGIGAGLAANVGINNTSGETAALVTKSQLEAYDVNVNATDKLTANYTGGVGAGGVGGVGVSVGLNNINSSVSAHVTDGSVVAANNIDVKAGAERNFNSSVTGVAVGGIGVGVNVAVTSINKGITDAQLSSATDEKGNSMGTDSGTKNEINVHLNGTTKDGKTYSGVNGAKGALGVDGAKFFGLKGTDSDLQGARNVQVSLATPATNKQGVHTEVSKETLTAAGNVNVKALDTSDIFEKNLEVTVGGGISATVADNIIHTNYDTDVTMNEAGITGKNVTVEAKQTQTDKGSDIEVKAGTGAIGIGVGVGYAGIVNKGATDVDITDSTIKGTENVAVSALDESKHKAQILNVGVSSINATTTFASVENKNNVGVRLDGTNNISAAKNITIDAKKANALEAHNQGVGVGGVNVTVNHATIEDGEKDDKENIVKGNAVAKITGTNGTFKADSFHFGATNDTKAKLSAGNVAVSIIGVSRMRGKGVMDMGAVVDAAGGSFNAKNVEFTSLLGSANGRTLEGNVKGHNISVAAAAPDAVVLDTTVNGTVKVANSTFDTNTDLLLDNASYVDRKAYIYDVTAGAVAVGNTSADISGTETLNSTLAGKSGVTKLNSLQVKTRGENTGKAFADAGGGGIVGYVGAHVSNTSTNKVKSTIGGKWDIAEEAYILATQNDETRLTASEGHGGVIGVGGTSVDNKIDTTTNTTVENNTEITANRVYVSTTNAIATGAYDDINGNGAKDVQFYTLKDHFGGVISGNRLRSLLDITEKGTVTIGQGAKITTDNLQEYVASSQNDLVNHAQAKGGGAVVVTDAVTENKLNINNTVDVQSGALLSNEKSASTEDILLSAYDNQTLNSHSEATVAAGVVSPLVAKNLTTMDRTSNVTIAGTIESGSNAGLYAGADKNGVLSNLKVDLKAGAYNYSAIPITSPTVDYKITADKGLVDVNGTVRSTRDINATASGGREDIVTDESKWAWVTGGKGINKKFLSSNATTGSESSAEMRKSTVSVTGALIAGTADPINLTIGGTVADGLTITADDNQANDRVKQGITQGTFDYANTLGARLAELNKLIAAYDGNRGDVTQMAAYINERNRIQDEMKRLGLVEKDAQGNVTSYVNSGRAVYYVEIPDIATSGGNINVKAEDFIGTGKLHANTAPPITITNASDAYLKLNNILMGEQGGSIVYSGYGAHLQNTVIPPETVEGNKKINEMNRNESGGSVANFSEIYGRTNGTAAGLLVQNTKTFSGDKESTIILTDEKKAQMRQEVNDDKDLSAEAKAQLIEEINNQSSITYTALTDIEVNGKISNFYGNVTISNASGDIRISGGSQEHPTGVFGNTVKLIAGNGTIAQDYKEGIVNINGDPEKYFVDKATTMKNNLGLSTTSTDAKTQDEAVSRDSSTQEATGYIAGRDVYVSAANINVNGLIQSGYKTYMATASETALAAAKQRPSDRAAVVQNRTMYKVNDGGAKWSSTDNAFYYEAQIYWDPATDKLVVEDIDTQGGKIYLTGKIASTGDGRVLAADGAAEITVENQTALDMNVGSVLNNQREGIITIADTAKDTWTEYRRGKTRTITGYAQYLLDHRNDGDLYAGAASQENSLSVGHDLQYDVQGNQTYSWVNGDRVETTRTYEHYVRKGMWGAIETVNEEGLKAWEQSSTPIDTTEGKKLGLPEGTVINQNSSNVPEYGKLHLEGSTKVLKDVIFDRTHDTWSSGFLGWFKHSRDRWKNGTTTIQLYDYSINASQPFKIGLIGSETGKIDIKSTNTNGGSINLTGNVANSQAAAALTVSSAAGGITQFDNTTLKSEIVNLFAKDDIKNIHIASLGQEVNNGTAVTDKIQLTAVSTEAGDIDITAAGGIRNNQSLPGNVEIVALKSQDGSNTFNSNAALGDVTLNAAGNITQSGSGVTIEGRGIYLTSKNGGIGTEGQAISIAASDLVYATDRSGAQVNAAAQGSIFLTEAEAGGNMRVGKIESKEGDITLTVTGGGFIDGLPVDDKTGSTEAVDDMVHRWIDAGLIDGEKDGSGNYTYKGAYIEGLEKSRDEYKANVIAAYDGKTQGDWQAEYARQKTAVTAIFASADYRDYKNGEGVYRDLDEAQVAAKLAADGHQNYVTYVKYGTADAYLQDTAAYKYSKYANADAYLAADATYKDLVNKAAQPTFEWTKDMMLYAVSEKIVNKDSGSSIQTERAANVLGRNITLNAAKGTVGTSTDKAVRITVDELASNEGIAKMKQIMNVSAADVTANRDTDGNLVSFDISNNMPLGVKSRGTLNVKAGGNISVAGRTDSAGEHSAINVGSVDAAQNGATGDVRLHSDQGIYNAGNSSDTNIKGRNLLLTGGKESIGTADKTLNISLTGELTEARANKNIFIRNMDMDRFLTLGAMYAGDTISLNSEKGFLMGSANSDIAVSYINAGKKLEFKTNETSGIVGDNDTNNAIRVLNNRAVINIAAKSAYIRGMGNLLLGIQNGTLTLGSIRTVGAFTAVSDGSLSVGREEEKDEDGNVMKTAVTGVINAGDDVLLSAKDELALDGTVQTGNLTLKAVNGNITQTDKGAITAGTVKTFNGKSLLLENAANQFSSLTVDGIETTAAEKPAIDGDVRIKDNDAALTAAIKRQVAGDIAVHNLRGNGTLANTGDLTAAGSIALGAQGTLRQTANTTFTAGRNVELSSVTADINQAADAGIKASKVTAVSAKSVDLQGAGNTFQSITVQGAAANTLLAGDVLVGTAADTLSLAVQPAVQGNIVAVNRDNAGHIQVDSALQAQNDEAAVTGSKGNVSLIAGGDVLINGDITTGMLSLQPLSTLDVNAMLTDPHNALTIRAGGAIKEAADVKIVTPLVDTYSGKGVSLENEENQFAIFMSKGLTDHAPINGSVKAKTSYDGNYVTAMRAEQIKGDAEFTNKSANGNLRLLVDNGTPANKLNVLGGNGTQGNLRLLAGKDITFLGDVYVQHNLAAATTGTGSIYGLGKGLEAGNDIFMQAKNSVFYIGTMKAANDINIQVGQADSANEDSGIHIGTLEGILDNAIEGHGNVSANTDTLFTAGNNVSFQVDGNGDIELLGNIKAENGIVKGSISGKGNIDIGQRDVLNEKTITAKGDVTLETGQGDIAIVKGIESEDESIKLDTGRGNIIVGRENVTQEESLIANKNVSIGTNTGTITIQGKTATVVGDISMKAGQDVYEPGIEHGNFIIREDGKIDSGAGINLYGRNGDIFITDKLGAKQSITAAITEQGSVIFATDVNVTKNVNISTENGFIAVGYTVNAEEGKVNLKTGTGDVLVGKDVTAGAGVDITTDDGSIVIGVAATGDDGDVLARSGDVSIKAAKGNVEIAKTVTAQTGSIDISTGNGEILIGDNGPDVKTVTARENINLETKEGRIVVYGKTSTEEGDITLAARRQEYVSGAANSSFVIDQNGKLEAGRTINLHVGNGDLHISDRIQAKEDLQTELEGKGGVYFDTDVNAAGSLNVKNNEGDIQIGHNVQAAKDIAMTAGKGSIQVGAAVASAEGSVELSTVQGIIDVGGTVSAGQDVALSTDTGNILVGEAVLAGNSVNAQIRQGDVEIQKAVTAKQGSIDVQVGTGGILIGGNGPDVETVTARENIDMSVDQGKIKIYGKTSTQNGDIYMSAGEETYTAGMRNIIIEQNGEISSGRDVTLTGRNGDLHVTDAVQAQRSLNVQVKNAGGVSFDSTVDVTGTVTARTENGAVSVADTLTGNLVDLRTESGDVSVGGDITSHTAVTIQAGKGNIVTENVTAQEAVNAAVTNGNITMHDVTAGADASVTSSEQGSINAHNIVSAGITHVALSKGDLFLNLAEGKGVLLQMEDNTAASQVNQVLAEAGGQGTDVALTGNYVQIGTLAAKGGDAVLVVSAMGAGQQKLISGNFTIGSLSAPQGTHIPTLWSNRGSVHVAEGQLLLDDVLAVDKLYVDNADTDMAIFGRTPTRDGQQLTYWNNLSMADSKARGYQLYTDGRVRTAKAVLIDAGRNLGKLYGDNLSVVDMMSERETNRHGVFTFDRRQLVEPDEKLHTQVTFDPLFWDFAGWQPEETKEAGPAQSEE
ncbi:hypothetical protein [Selenomonas ruminantium]|uniref:hypothetical protein n=1 Tax=Selenomonas ruminantium TaxID=971 RepID=UPI0026E9B42B|nr:hypothetical protein [Selenomonas ruminantium]